MLQLESAGTVLRGISPSGDNGTSGTARASASITSRWGACAKIGPVWS
jgi:hypothetical protein